LIELGRFDKFDLVELVLSEWDSHIPKALLDTIFEHTGGNPLFIREVVQSLVAENLVTYEDGAWHYPEPGAVQLPQSLQDIVRRRVDMLDSTTQTLLQQAAVLGQEFQIDVLQEMSELSEWPLLENLDNALQEGFIRETRDDGVFRFEHHDIRLALYEAIPAVRRRLWHKVAGEILEQFGEPEPEAIAEVLAVHFIEAELAEKGILYSYQAAQQAQAAYNNEAAVDWYRQTTTLLDGLDAQRHEAFAADHAAALLNLGKVLELAGEWDQAVEKYQASNELAEAHGDRSAVAWSQIALGELFRKQGLFEDALQRLDEAGKGLEDIGDKEGLAQTLQYKGVVAVQQADLQTAHEYFVQSLALRRELGNEVGIGHLLNNLAIVAEYRGAFAESMNLHEEALALRREIGDRRAIAVSLNNLGYLTLLGSDYEPARDYLEESIALYHEIGDRWSLAQALANLGAVARETGDFAEARKLYVDSLGILLDMQDPWAKAYLLDDVARLIYAEGDAEQALRLIGAAMSLRGSIAAPLPGIEKDALDEFRGQLEADVGEAAGDVMAGGEALTADEALRLALELVSKN
jgi:predicted ATPase